MLKYIIAAIFLFVIGMVGIFCYFKGADSYLDWLANYNLPKDIKDKKDHERKRFS